jgi:hypothetical protein
MSWMRSSAGVTARLSQMSSAQYAMAHAAAAAASATTTAGGLAATT